MALLDLEVSICIHILSDLCYLNFQIEKEKAMQWLRACLVTVCQIGNVFRWLIFYDPLDPQELGLNLQT